MDTKVMPNIAIGTSQVFLLPYKVTKPAYINNKGQNLMMVSQFKLNKLKLCINNNAPKIQRIKPAVKF